MNGVVPPLAPTASVCAQRRKFTLVAYELFSGGNETHHVWVVCQMGVQFTV